MASKNIEDVLTAEYNRLNAKRKTIDDATSGQKRAVILNDNYRKRFSRYTQIVMVISLVIVIYLGVLASRKSLTMIPEWISDVFLAFVFFGGTIYCILIIQEIMTRSILNYDELDLPVYEESTPST
jgi:hypothetical protein